MGSQGGGARRRGVAEHRWVSYPDRGRRFLRLRRGGDVADAGGGTFVAWRTARSGHREPPHRGDATEAERTGRSVTARRAVAGGERGGGVAGVSPPRCRPGLVSMCSRLP